MIEKVVVLSGPISAGKSTLAKALDEQYHCRVVRTRDLIRAALPEVPDDRKAMQDAGDRMDRRTGGTWVADALSKITAAYDDGACVVVDSARIRPQIRALRTAYGPRVVHVHLTAPEAVLERRYRRRKHKMRELANYRAVRDNETESRVEDLAENADILIHTERCTPSDVVARAASHLGFFGRSYRRLADVIIGGCYGSEGKGHVAAYLSREYDLLVRVGGPNAGHTVYEEPLPYTHHHLPSGTRKSEARLLLPAGSVIYVPKLLEEIAESSVDKTRLSIDPQAMVISEADRRREERLKKAIGSTGQGVGAATARRILMRGAGVKLAGDIKELRPYVKETQPILDDAFYRGLRVFVEGTQGTGLSLYHGHYPHVTSRDTTVGGCLAEAGIAPSRVRKIIMVVRTYPIRVQSPRGGTSGPIGTELSWADVSARSGIPEDELRRAEKTSTTKRRRRVAEFDWALLRRAASLNGPTDIALTFADYLGIANRKARRYDRLSPETIRFVDEVERVAAAPVSLITVRFDFRSIIDRRAW